MGERKSSCSGAPCGKVKWDHRTAMVKGAGERNRDQPSVPHSTGLREEGGLAKKSKVGNHHNL